MPDFCIFMCIYLLLPWVTTSNHSHCSIHCAEKGIPQKIIANYEMLNFECYCTSALYIFIQVPTWFQINRNMWGKPRAFMEQTNATPQKRVAGACRNDRVPWRNTELLHELSNICYLQQVYKWSFCELNTEVYQHDRVSQRGTSSQHIRPPHFSSVFCSYSWAWCRNQALKKQLLILFFSFLERSEWEKVKVLWGRMQVRTNTGTVQKSHFHTSSLPPAGSTSFIIHSRSGNCADNDATNSQWWKLDST